MKKSTWNQKRYTQIYHKWYRCHNMKEIIKQQNLNAYMYMYMYNESTNVDTNVEWERRWYSPHNVMTNQS